MTHRKHFQEGSSAALGAPQISKLAYSQNAQVFDNRQNLFRLLAKRERRALGRFQILGIHEIGHLCLNWRMRRAHSQHSVSISWPRVWQLAVACCTQRLQSARCFSTHGFVVFGRSWNFLGPTHYPKCSLSHDAACVTRCLVLRRFGDILISSSEVSSVACSLHCFQSAFSLIKWLKTIPWTSTLAHGSSSKEHRFVIGLLAEVSINVSTPDGRICVCCWTFL